MSTTRTDHPEHIETAQHSVEWLLDVYRESVERVRDELLSQANGNDKAFGLSADRRALDVLKQSGNGRLNPPSPATVAAYRRDYRRLLEDKLTPLAKASTFQHHNRLRSAFRFCEAEAIEVLRAKAEGARRAKDYEAMRAYTLQACDRAAVFEAMFLADDRPTWGSKAAALRAAGGKTTSGKSKRAAGRRAPSPDELLVASCNYRRRATRVEVGMACFSLFGIRPAELRKGVRLIERDGSVGLLVEGAKVDSVRGQPVRELVLTDVDPRQAGICVGVLRDLMATGVSLVKLSDADLKAVRRAMNDVQTGLSPYAYRHARASDVKAASGGDRQQVANWMGHASDRTQSAYGHRRSSVGALKAVVASATRSVRAVKSLPADLLPGVLERLAHSTKPAAPASLLKRKPRLRR